jgi:hypothetical protein
VAALPAGTSAATAEAVRQAGQFGRHLHVTRAARRAVANLTCGQPDRGLGLILATDHGDQHVVAARMAEFARLMERGERAPADLFRAIAYFPAGRVLRGVAERAGATGPITVMPGNLAQAHALAQVWLAAGRADRVAVVAADPARAYPGADAEASLWHGDGPAPVTPPALAVTAQAELAPEGDSLSCAELATRVIEAVAPARGPRTALIVGSMLAEAGEALFARVAPRDPGQPLEPSVRSLAGRLGLGEVFVLVGSPGATMTALALAQVLIALDRADQVVVCGVDLVHGALASALGLLKCDDLPSMRGGAIAVTLAREPAKRATLERCWLGSPVVPARPGTPMDLGGLGPVPSVPPVEQVVLSGLTSTDLAGARQLAGKLWPRATIRSRSGQRSVAADVLHIVARAKPGAVAAVHSLGGTGWCLISPPGRS